MYYGDLFIIGQIIKAINPPEKIANYVCKDREVNQNRLRYDVNTGPYLVLYETIEYLVLRGDDEEHFLNYGYCEENSKILHSAANAGYQILFPVHFSIAMVSSLNVALEMSNWKQIFSICIIFYLQ